MRKLSTTVAVLLFCVAIAASGVPREESAASAHRERLVILSTDADASTGRLYITGKNFGGALPHVRLNDQELSVTMFTPDAITAILPAGIASGSYRLEVVAEADAQDSFVTTIMLGDRTDGRRPKPMAGESGKKITSVVPGPGLEGGGNDGAVSLNVAPAGIVTSMIAGGAVTGTQIANAAVGTAQLATGAVTSPIIANGAVGTAQIANGAVTSTQIASGSVGTAQLASGAVTSAQISAGAVGSAQIAPLAVTTLQIAPNAVTSSQIAPNAVTSAQIAPNAVTATQIAPGAITAAQIAPGTIGSSTISDGSIGAEKLNATASAKGQVLTSNGANAAWKAALPAGVLMPFAGMRAPEGYLLCDGSAVSRTDYADLFAAIGTAYGAGDGATTFNLPDLRGRVAVGAGQGTGLSTRGLGASFGEESHTISTSEMPSHSHDGYTDVAGNHSHLMGYPVERECRIRDHVESGVLALWLISDGRCR